jgi:hypothetical protein
MTCVTHANMRACVYMWVSSRRHRCASTSSSSQHTRLLPLLPPKRSWAVTRAIRASGLPVNLSSASRVSERGTRARERACAERKLCLYVCVCMLLCLHVDAVVSGWYRERTNSRTHELSHADRTHSHTTHLRTHTTLTHHTSLFRAALESSKWGGGCLRASVCWGQATKRHRNKAPRRLLPPKSRHLHANQPQRQSRRPLRSRSRQTTRRTLRQIETTRTQRQRETTTRRLAIPPQKNQLLLRLRQKKRGAVSWSLSGPPDLLVI